MYEHIYRDALAVSLGLRAKVEVSVDSSNPNDKDLVDIVHDDGNHVVLIEVKRAELIRDAIGQCNSYAKRYKTTLPIKKRLHLVLSNDRSVRAYQLNKIQLHRKEWIADEIEISTVNECRDQPVYTLGVTSFADQKIIGSINSIVNRIVADFAVAEYLHPESLQVLTELADGYMQRYEIGRADRVSLAKTSRGVSMSVNADRWLSIRDCIPAWVAMQRYRFVNTHSASFLAETQAA